MSQTQSALLVGATGLVGGHVLARLLQDPDYSRIHVLTRRPLAQADAKLEVRIQPFDRIADLAWEEPDFFAVDHVYCCLGTTLKAAGSKQAFATVDYGYVKAVAEAAAAAGARRFALVSAVGADSRSPFFYNRIKGRVEAAVAALDFEAVDLVRPSLLLGERTEHRTGEAAGQRLAPLLSGLLVGPLRKFKPVAAEAVARHMIERVKAPAAGARVSYPTAPGA